jgi:dTDP-glucose 4,6-dehydratase
MSMARSLQKLLVTGGCGFIGANFVRAVLRAWAGVEVVNLDCLSYSGNLENLAGVEASAGGRYRFVRGDVCDEGVVGPLVAWCDAVVHLAAESHVDRSIADPRPFVMSNVVGTEVLLEALRKADAGGGSGAPGRRVVYVSTDEVYGPLAVGAPGFTEQSPLRPTNPYSASKAGGDVLAQAYHRTFGLDVVVTRCTNNFGPWQFPEKVVPLFVTRIVQGKAVPLYGDGLHVRDWMHVDDHCSALLAVLKRGRAGGVYNIGAENERSNVELTRSILKAMGYEGERAEKMIQPVADRAGHDRRYRLDTGLIRRELGWKPVRTDWDTELAGTVRWYVENERWWRRVLSGEYRKGR